MACKYIFNGIEFKDKDTFIKEYLIPNFINQPKTLRVQEIQQPDFLKEVRRNSAYLSTLGLSKEQESFLNLLFGKKEQWSSFFVKSLIQNASKKGYEKVLFPKGDTAAKIEGHQTLEEFKKQKEDRIKELENSKTDLSEDLIVEYDDYGNAIGNRLVEGDELLNSKNKEIERLKQELADVESGKTKLSSIANFYEITVSNILKKNGYNPVEITDEYGNKWNEVKIEKSSQLENYIEIHKCK